MATYTREQLIGALRKADAAGDVEAAKAIALRIKGMEQPQQAEEAEVEQPMPEEVKAQQEAAQAPEQPEEDRSLFDKAVGVGETALNIGTGIVAQPIAGLRGLADLATGGDLESATELIESTQEELTYDPRSEAGQEYQQAIGETLQPVGEFITETGESLGDAVREGTGSYVLGGIAQSIPEGVLELLGVKGAGRLAVPKVGLSKQPKIALSQSAPEIKDLRKRASDLYKEIDDLGAVVSKSDYLDFGVKLNNMVRKHGYDQNLTPKTRGFLERLQSDFNKNEIKVTDIDQLRKNAQVAANSIDNPTEAALGSRIIHEIDDFLDDQGVKLGKQKGVDVGQKYRDARQLTARVKKAEIIDEAVFKAGESASGFENGLRNEMRSILKNKKRRRGFNAEEIKAMQEISQGGTYENLFKKLGKLGFGADQQTNMLLGVVGSVGGGVTFGPAGALITPAIGQVSAKIAEKLGKRNVDFVRTISAAGNNAENITKAYIENVPRNAQRAEELAALLSNPRIDISDIKSLASYRKGSKRVIDDAEFLLKRLRQAQLAGALAAQAPDKQEQEE